MTAYLVRRLVALVPTIFVALSFLFFLFFLLPGDPADLLAGGGDRTVDPGVVERIEERYGLNDPILVQFGDFWSRTLRWDLGESFLNGRSVNEILGERAVASLRLSIWAILLEVVVGIAVGLISAIRRYSLRDKVTTLATAAAAAVPVFVFGFVVQQLFAVQPNKLGWPDWAKLRVQGIGPDTWTFFFIPTGEQWRYLVLPAITLASVSTALATRMMRGSMLEVLRADYMRTARAKGLGERAVVLRHGLRNALIPVVTLIGIDFGTVIGSAILTETVFNWPGLGSSIASAVQARDAPVLLGLTLVVVVAYTLINLLVDVSYAWFDPRIRLGEADK
ncbi:MAG: ABC transporter permease [Acidimicrobiia bacterium]|nr:ABC transporter permease [Acidimicrobiia bacterium]